jgi:hypothetical protein
MKYSRTFAALILAGAAFSSSAQDTPVVVGPDQACPAGTATHVPSYTWQDGRFVRDGWLCESIYKGRN